jgi:hypothetical protein
MIKCKRQELLLLALPLLVLLLIPGAKWLNNTATQANKTPGLVLEAGTYSYAPAAEKDVMRKLSRAITAHPQITIPAVRWTVVDSQGRHWPKQLILNRRTEQTYFEVADPNPQQIVHHQLNYTNVTNGAVHEVSREGGVIKALSWHDATLVR